MYNHAPPDYVCPLCALVRQRNTAEERLPYAEKLRAYLGAGTIVSGSKGAPPQ